MFHKFVSDDDLRQCIKCGGVWDIGSHTLAEDCRGVTGDCHHYPNEHATPEPCTLRECSCLRCYS